jgi:hypothetical protein
MSLALYRSYQHVESAHVVSATETELGEDLGLVLRVRGAECVAADKELPRVGYLDNRCAASRPPV